MIIIIIVVIIMITIMIMIIIIIMILQTGAKLGPDYDIAPLTKGQDSA